GRTSVTTGWLGAGWLTGGWLTAAIMRRPRGARQRQLTGHGVPITECRSRSGRRVDADRDPEVELRRAVAARLDDIVDEEEHRVGAVDRREPGLVGAVDRHRDAAVGRERVVARVRAGLAEEALRGDR